MTLTESQRRAITHLGSDLCVVAGPGSGKTRVLVERFCWLVENGHAPPGRILAITFTDRAADEIRRRLASRFQGSPLRAEIERAPVLTVDGLCTRLLKEHAIAAGIDPEFRILDERDAAIALREAVDAAANRVLRTDEERLRDLYNHWAVEDPASAIASAYEAIRLASVDWPQPPQPVALKPAIQRVHEALRSAPRKTPKQQEAVQSVREWLQPIEIASDPANVEFGNVELSRYGGEGAKALKEAIERVKLTLVSIRNHDRLIALDDLLRDVDQRYSAAKRAASVVDFSDLELLVIRMLRERPALRAIVQSRYDFILMDELQDTNPLQWQLIELIRTRDRFFAVGDINQAIYGFRHANPDAFRGFRQQMESADSVVYLRENFRSREGILQAAERIAGTQPGMEPPGLIAGRAFDDEDPSSVERILVDPGDRGDIAAMEAYAVCQRIRELQRNGIPWGDMAILSRTGNRFSALEDRLRRSGISYLLVGGRAFFEQQEALDLINWLRVLANPLDEIALAGVLRSPFVGIADDVLLEIRNARPLIESVRSSNDPRLKQFLQELDEARSQRNDVSADLILGRIIDRCDYMSTLDALQRANVGKFLSLLRNRVAQKSATMADLVAYLQRLASSANEPNAPAAKTLNAVQLMTVHAAKGLEFPVVFLAGLDLRASADRAGLWYSAATGLGAKWRTASGDSRDLAAETFRIDQSRSEKREANRTFYVGLTRAERKLILSHGPKSSEWAALVASEPVTRRVETMELGEPISPAATAVEDIEILDPPPRGPQFETAATPTDLTLFLDCPRRYFLERYIGCDTASQPRAEPQTSFDTVGVPGREFGGWVHRLLAGAPGDEAPDEARQLADAFRASALGRRVEAARRVEREFAFTAELDGLILNGQIDLWFEDEQGMVVVDYKTDRWDSSTETLAQTYAPQIRLYSVVLEKLNGRTVSEGLLAFLRPGLVVPVGVSPASRLEILQSTRRFRDAQESLDFPLEEGERCERCPYWRGLCPSRYGARQLDLFG